MLSTRCERTRFVERRGVKGFVEKAPPSAPATETA
jgi:hypothetical protein